MPQPATNKWYSMRALAAGTLELSIYEEIGGWGITAADFKRDLDYFGDVGNINLRIHSPGGGVFDGMAIYNMLRAHPARVHVFVDGLAASIASFIAMAGDEVTIPSNAFMMIHKPWSMSAGDAEALRQDADLLDKVESTLIAAYRDRTGLTDADIADMLAAETWLTGEEAVGFGFADNLAEPIKVAASLKTGLTERFNSMPNEAQTLIGKADPNSPAPAVQDAAPAAAAPAATAPSVADFKAAEKPRRDNVRAVFSDFPEHSGVMARCLDDMECSEGAARDALLAAMKAERTAGPSAAQVHVGNGAIVRDSIRNSVAARVGLEQLEGGNEFSAMTLLDLARASLVQNGVGVSGLDRMTLVANAFTHSSGDFGIALQDVAEKAMLKGYAEADETFQRWTSRGSLSDFKVSKRVDMSAFPSLRKVKEGAEYKYVTASDRGEQIMLATYGELFSITRQAIINDDLGVFDRVPRLMGRAAIRTIGDLVYAVLNGNPKMSDNVDLFHAATHKNVSTGAFGVSAIDAAKTKMATQKDGGASLNIRPAFLLTPVALESAAKAYLGAEFDPAYTDKNVPNPVRNMVEVIADARLDDESAVVTYMTANPASNDTIEVAYLDGNDQPFMEQQSGFTVDGATFKVRMDAGVAPLSFRTMVKMTNA